LTENSGIDMSVLLYRIQEEQELKDITSKFCIDCQQQTLMEYVATYIKESNERWIVYECLHGKHRLFSFKEED
jgi:hypothetical protein